MDLCLLFSTSLGKNSRLISLRLSQALLIPNTNFFYKSNGVTRRFPLYWQEEVQRFKSLEDQMLTPKDRQDTTIIMEFPRMMNINEILNLPYFGDIKGSLESEYYVIS